MDSGGRRTRDGELTRTVYTFIQDRRFEDAVTLLNEYGESNRNSRSLLSLLAFCYYYLGEFTIAADLYERLTILFPRVRHYWLGLADCYCKCLLPGEARKVLERIASDFSDADAKKQQQQGATLKADDERESLFHHDDENQSTPNRNSSTGLPANNAEGKSNFTSYRMAHNNLSAAVAFYEERYQDALSWLGKNDDENSAVTFYNKGVIACKQARFQAAARHFDDAQTHAFGAQHIQADLKYGLAYAYYKSKNQHTQQAQTVAEDIVKLAMDRHQEYRIGARTEGVQTQKIANSWLLERSRIIEACNLLFTIEYERRNFVSAKRHLTDIPARDEEDIDAFTLHNECIADAEQRPEFAIDSLGTLFQLGEPRQVLSNLLILLLRCGRESASADLLAENAAIATDYLDEWFVKYIRAVLLAKTDYADAYMKFEQLLNVDEAEMRKLRQERMKLRTLQVATTPTTAAAAGTTTGGTAAAAKIETEEDVLSFREEQVLQRYIPVLMSQAKMFWDARNYEQVRLILAKGDEFAARALEYKINAGHTFFMLGSRETVLKPESIDEPSSYIYQSIALYGDVLRSKYNKKEFLKIPASVIANIAICYVLCHNSEDASEVLSRINALEEGHAQDEASEFYATASKFEYSTYISVAVGVLYATRGVLGYGLHRICDSMQKCFGSWKAAEKSDVLMRDAWKCAKCVILHYIEKLLLMLTLDDGKTLQELLDFLTSCERNFVHLYATTDEQHLIKSRHSIAYEARTLRHLLLHVKLPM